MYLGPDLLWIYSHSYLELQNDAHMHGEWMGVGYTQSRCRNHVCIVITRPATYFLY